MKIESENGLAQRRTCQIWVGALFEATWKFPRFHEGGDGLGYSVHGYGLLITSSQLKCLESGRANHSLVDIIRKWIL